MRQRVTKVASSRQFDSLSTANWRRTDRARRQHCLFRNGAQVNKVRRRNRHHIAYHHRSCSRSRDASSILKRNRRQTHATPTKEIESNDEQHGQFFLFCFVLKSVIQGRTYYQQVGFDSGANYHRWNHSDVQKHNTTTPRHETRHETRHTNEHRSVTQ